MYVGDFNTVVVFNFEIPSLAYVGSSAQLKTNVLQTFFHIHFRVSTVGAANLSTKINNVSCAFFFNYTAAVVIRRSFPSVLFGCPKRRPLSLTQACALTIGSQTFPARPVLFVRGPTRIQPLGILSACSTLIKSYIFGVIIAVISCAWGITTNGGAKGVGESTTSAVVISLVVIFIADFVLSFLFFQGAGDSLKAALG